MFQTIEWMAAGRTQGQGWKICFSPAPEGFEEDTTPFEGASGFTYEEEESGPGKLLLFLGFILYKINI